ncbi:hypothetical protein [Nostoc sp.]|uniref:hypothetical protein n=1 Tax=Nostoc sp. TaxID=1180 RepID=UPI002FF89996
MKAIVTRTLIKNGVDPDYTNLIGHSLGAHIADFNATDDTLQLSGSNSSYSLGAAPNGLATGTALFLNETSPELVAIIQGSSNLTLSASYFLTV